MDIDDDDDDDRKTEQDLELGVEGRACMDSRVCALIFFMISEIGEIQVIRMNCIEYWPHYPF